MKLWLLCFVIIFAAAEGLQGLSGLSSGFPTHFWHPLTVLAGIGLAILSNATALGLGASQSPPTSPDHPLPTPAAPPSRPVPPVPPAMVTPKPNLNPKATQATATQSTTTQAKTTPSKTVRAKATRAKATPSKPRSQAKAKADSISFEIRQSSPPPSP